MNILIFFKRNSLSCFITLMVFFCSTILTAQPKKFDPHILPQNMERIQLKYDDNCKLIATKAPVGLDEIQSAQVILSVLDIRLKCNPETNFYLRVPLNSSLRTFIGNEICKRAFPEYQNYAKIKVAKLNTSVLPEQLSRSSGSFLNLENDIQLFDQQDPNLPIHAKETIDSVLCLMVP